MTTLCLVISQIPVDIYTIPGDFQPKELVVGASGTGGGLRGSPVPWQAWRQRMLAFSSLLGAQEAP